MSDIINFFKSLPDTGNQQEFLLEYLYQMEGDPYLAAEVNNAIIAKFPNTPLGVKAEINNMLIDLYVKNDAQDAVALLAKVESQADLTTPMELQDAEEAVALYSGRSASGVQASSQSSESTAVSTAPKSFGLDQNYPNPFNPSTILRYETPKAGRVEVTVYDILVSYKCILCNKSKKNCTLMTQKKHVMTTDEIFFNNKKSVRICTICVICVLSFGFGYAELGRVVETLVDEYEQAGVHRVQFSAERLASGVYFYRLTAPGVTQVKKMLLIK